MSVFIPKEDGFTEENSMNISEDGDSIASLPEFITNDDEKKDDNDTIRSNIRASYLHDSIRKGNNNIKDLEMAVELANIEIQRRKREKLKNQRNKYKETLAILCVLLMIIYAGYTNVLGGYAVLYFDTYYPDHSSFGRYLISIYALSRLLSRIFLLILKPQCKPQRNAFYHSFFLMISSLIFLIPIIFHLILTKWFLYNITIYKSINIFIVIMIIAFFSIGMFAAGIKSSLFALLVKIQPISGFISSLFLLGKCIGEGFFIPIFSSKMPKYYLYFIIITGIIVFINASAVIKIFMKHQYLVFKDTGIIDDGKSRLILLKYGGNNNDHKHQP